MTLFGIQGILAANIAVFKFDFWCMYTYRDMHTVHTCIYMYTYIHTYVHTSIVHACTRIVNIKICTVHMYIHPTQNIISANLSNYKTLIEPVP